MALTRKIRKSGRSFVLAIPSQLVDAYDIRIGDEMEVIPLHDGIKVRRFAG